MWMMEWIDKSQPMTLTKWSDDFTKWSDGLVEVSQWLWQNDPMTLQSDWIICTKWSDKLNLVSLWTQDEFRFLPDPTCGVSDNYINQM
jgi:hypothetical protein